MKITVFTSNQPRHLHLVNQLSLVSDEVFFVNEVNTIFSGIIEDKIPKSNIMAKYFSSVLESEKKIFGNIDFLPSNVKTLSIKYNDLSQLDKSQLKLALNSDLYVVFGASYIKGWLIDFLIKHQAVNIHMGLSPYYRGTACNFWALQDNNPSYVGATIHMLSKGLDNGDMLFHCLPKLRLGDNSFDFTMRSVSVAHFGLLDAISNGKLFNRKTVKQDKSKEKRYSKKQDFSDKIAEEFLLRDIKLDSKSFLYPELLYPVFK